MVLHLFYFDFMVILFCVFLFVLFFFFNDTATTEIYTLSLHDALPICAAREAGPAVSVRRPPALPGGLRSEEHTSELQSHLNLVCRLLLEKKKTTKKQILQKKKKKKHINIKNTQVKT